jgi:hypothetical protein
MIETGNCSELADCISIVVRSDAFMLSSFENYFDKVSIVLKDLVDMAEQSMCCFSDDIFRFISESFVESNFRVRHVLLELETIASSQSTFERFCLLCRVLERNKELSSKAHSFLERLMSRSLLEMLVTHTQYLFWRISPQHLPLSVEPARGISGIETRLSGFTAKLPGVVGNLRLIKSQVSRLHQAFGCRVVSKKTTELIAAISGYLERFELSSVDQTKLNSEYQQLSDSLSELQSAQQKYSMLSDGGSVAFKDSQLLMSQTRIELLQRAADEEIIEVSIEATESDIAELAQ